MCDKNVQAWNNNEVAGLCPAASFAFYTIYSDLFRFLIYEQISPAYYPFGNRPHGSAGAIRLAAKPVFYGAGLL